MENNLFTATAWAELISNELVVTKRERVVVDTFIELEGIKFDAEDLYETLCEVKSGRVTTNFSREKTDVLKKYGILKTEGSNRSCIAAELGANGKDFIKMLKAKIWSE